MAHDNIEIVDRDYIQCSKEAMPRQIRTRRNSFNSIFSKFRKKLYESKMNRVIDKTLSSTYTEDNIGKKLLISSERIAALENKIKRLSKDDVPTKFVKRRAIKLRKYMMDNALKNAEGLYMIGLDKEDLMNFDNPVEEQKSAESESVIPDVVDINNENIQSVEVANDFVPGDDVEQKPVEQPIDLASNDIDKESIGNLINEEFNNLENSDEATDVDSVTKFVSPEEVSMVVGSNPSIDDVTIDDDNNSNIVEPVKDVQNELEEVEVSEPVVEVPVETNNNIEVAEPVNNVFEEFSFEGKDEKVEPVAETKAEDDPVTEVPVENVVEDPVSDVIVEPVEEQVQEEPVAEKVNTIGLNIDNIKEEINRALNDIKVSKSEASVAKVDKFDEHGKIRFRDHYTPMTDEEIAASQQKIDEVPEYKEEPYTMPTGSIFEKKSAFENLFVPAKDVQFSFEQKEEKESEKRDVPIVVEPRDEGVADIKSFDENNDVDEYAFDLIEEAAPKAVEIKSEVSRKASPSRIDEISRLKERVLELKKRREETNKNMIAAQNSAVETAKRAEKVKEQAAEVREVLDRKYEEFKKYCEGLEKNCEETDKEIGLIESDIQMNNNFIAQQQGFVEENNKMIDEIDMIISERPRTR